MTLCLFGGIMSPPFSSILQEHMNQVPQHQANCSETSVPGLTNNSSSKLIHVSEDEQSCLSSESLTGEGDAGGNFDDDFFEDDPCLLYGASVHLIRLPDEIIELSRTDATRAIQEVSLLERKMFEDLNLRMPQFLQHFNQIDPTQNQTRPQAQQSPKPPPDPQDQAHPQPSIDTSTGPTMKTLTPHNGMTSNDNLNYIRNDLKSANLFQESFKVLTVDSSVLYGSLKKYSPFKPSPGEIIQIRPDHQSTEPEGRGTRVTCNDWSLEEILLKDTVSNKTQQNPFLSYSKGDQVSSMEGISNSTISSKPPQDPKDDQSYHSSGGLNASVNNEDDGKDKNDDKDCSIEKTNLTSTVFQPDADCSGTNSTGSPNDSQSKKNDPCLLNEASIHLVRLPDWIIELSGEDASKAARHIGSLSSRRLKHLNLRRAQIRKKRHRTPNSANAPPIHQPIAHSQLIDVTPTASDTKSLPPYDRMTVEDCLGHIGNSVESFYVFQQLFRILINCISVVHQKLHKYEILSERRLLTFREKQQETKHYLELDNLTKQMIRARKISSMAMESKDSQNGADFSRSDVTGSTDLSFKLPQDSEDGQSCLPMEILNGDEHVDIGFEEESSIEKTCWTSFGDIIRDPFDPSMVSSPLIKKPIPMTEPWLEQIFGSESDLNSTEIDLTRRKLAWKYRSLEKFFLQEIESSNVPQSLLRPRKNCQASSIEADYNRTTSSKFSQDPKDGQSLLCTESLDGDSDTDVKDCKIRKISSTSTTFQPGAACSGFSFTELSNRIQINHDGPCPLYEAAIHLIRLPDEVITSSRIDASKASRRVKLLEGRRLKHLNLSRAQIRKKRNRAKRSSKLPPNHPEQPQTSNVIPTQSIMESLPPYAVLTVKDCLNCIGNAGEPTNVFNQLYAILNKATSDVYKGLDKYKDIRNQRSLTLVEMQQEARYHRELANLNEQMIEAMEMSAKSMKSEGKDESLKESSLLELCAEMKKEPGPIIHTSSSTPQHFSPTSLIFININ